MRTSLSSSASTIGSGKQNSRVSPPRISVLVKTCQNVGSFEEQPEVAQADPLLAEEVAAGLVAAEGDDVADHRQVPEDHEEQQRQRRPASTAASPGAAPAARGARRRRPRRLGGGGRRRPRPTAVGAAERLGCHPRPPIRRAPVATGSTPYRREQQPPDCRPRVRRRSGAAARSPPMSRAGPAEPQLDVARLDDPPAVAPGERGQVGGHGEAHACRRARLQRHPGVADQPHARAGWSAATGSCR